MPPQARQQKPRIGVFGGTFDPPHVGHLVIAERARDQLRLDRVVFVPAGVPPHKLRRTITPPAVRLAMIRAAVRSNPAFEVSTLELRRRGPSYTIDTLRALRSEVGDVRLYLLMGQDSLDEFHTWHEPAEIMRNATLVVAPRPEGRRRPKVGHGQRGRRSGAIPHGRVIWLDAPSLAISSSEIRAWVRTGRSIRYLVPDRVADHISRHGLYRHKS